MLRELLSENPQGLRELKIQTLTQEQKAELLEEIREDLKFGNQALYAKELGITRNWYSTIINQPEQIQDRIVQRAIILFSRPRPATEPKTVHLTPILGKATPASGRQDTRSMIRMLRTQAEAISSQNRALLELIAEFERQVERELGERETDGKHPRE